MYGKENAPVVVGGRYGLSSKDTTPAQIVAVYENLAMNLPKNQFTIGIVDDVTFTSLPPKEEIIFENGPYEAKFYGLELMVLLVLTRTLLRLSVIIPISIARLISLTTQRNRAVLPVLTFVLVITPSVLPIW